MKRNVRLNLLGGYDLFLSLGAVHTGITMILGKGGFNEFPEEWLTKVPFQNWVLPGIIGIAVFGLGNFIAAIFAFRKKGNLAWLMSTVMAVIFFLSLVTQYLIFRERYLPAGIFLMLSIIQILICVFAYIGYAKGKMV